MRRSFATAGPLWRWYRRPLSSLSSTSSGDKSTAAAAGGGITTSVASEQSKPPQPTFSAASDASPLLATPLTDSPPSIGSRIVYPATLDPGHEPDSQVTRLSNGLRVATQNTYGQFCTVGVVIDAGSRYEVNFPSGVSHFLEKLAFQGTPRYPNRDAVLCALEGVGGICDAQAGRDVIIYGASADVRGLETAVDVLSDCVLRPLLDDAEVTAAAAAVRAELDTLEMSPMQDQKLAEWAHQTAYANNTLGLPRTCPLENVEGLDRRVLVNFLSAYFRPERMVLCGVGVDHQRLVGLAEKCFVHKRPMWCDEFESLLLDPKQLAVDTSVAQYTGGSKKIIRIPITDNRRKGFCAQRRTGRRKHRSPG